jgi:hypothetical protein
MATAVGRGTANIRATVTVGASHDYTPGSVPLHVAICGGLLDLNSWTATVSTVYSVVNQLSSGGSTYNYTINQGSSGTATLQLVSRDTTSNDMSTTWEGVASGTAHVGNTVVQTIGQDQFTSTEVGSGPLLPALAFVRLIASWSPGSGCRYSIRYQDDLSYKDTESDGTTFTLQFSAAITADRDRQAGTKPAGGWRFDSAPDVPGALFPDGPDLSDDDISPLGLAQFYLPTPAIPGAMLTMVGGNNQFGTAKFTYTVIAQ